MTGNTLLSRLSLPEAQSYYAAGHWRSESIFTLFATQARNTPNKPAVLEASRELTYRELLQMVERLSSALRRAGLRRGDRLAVWLPNRAEVAAATLLASRDGYVVCTSLHRDHTVADVIALLDRMRASAFIGQRGYGADGETRDVFAEVQEIPNMKFVIDLDRGPITAADSGLADGVQWQNRHADDPDRISYLAFTSGSTGEPKGVMHSDNTILAPVRALQRDWHFHSGDVIYSLSPLSHNLGFAAMVLAATVGATFVVHDLGRGASVADRIDATGTTFVYGVPTHAVDLLSELEKSPERCLQSLRGFRVSGAAIGEKVAEALVARGVSPQSGYGMTEGGSHHYTLPDDPPHRVVQTSGRPFEGHETAVFSKDDADEPVRSGTIGQIATRGPSLMLGYFDDQRQTEEAFNRSGWFLTGDMGSIHEDGYIRITGRKKDLIIRGGHNIYPARIERLALRHADVEQAAAFPVEDARLGEKVCLAVSLVAESSASGEELLQHLHDQGLSKYDMPEYLLTVDQIPLTASGKVFKRRLEEAVTSGELEPRPIRFSSNQ